MGQRRDVLVIRSDQFSDRVCVAAAWTFGRWLQIISCQLTLPSILGPAPGDSEEDDAPSDAFLEADFEAFVGVVRLCLRRAVEELKTSLTGKGRTDPLTRGPFQ